MNRGDLHGVMTEAELIKLLQDFVRTPTENPPGKEKTLVEKIALLAEQCGLKYEVDEYSCDHCNIYMTIGDCDSSGTRLLFNGHTDVVPAGDGWSCDPYAGGYSPRVHVRPWSM